MMKNVNPQKTGLFLGMLFGGFHLVWALLVASGLAQPIANFIFQIHMIEPFVTIAPFDITNAALLVIITSTIGYIIGYFAGLIWNRVHR